MLFCYQKERVFIQDLFFHIISSYRSSKSNYKGIQHIRSIHKSQRTHSTVDHIRRLYNKAYVHENAVSFRSKHTNKRFRSIDELKKMDRNSKGSMDIDSDVKSYNDYHSIRNTDHVNSPHSLPHHGIVAAETNNEVTIFQEEDEYGDPFTVTPSILGNIQNLGYNFGWNLDRLDQRNLPLDELYKPLNNGTSTKTPASSVHVYVVDTGIDNQHNAFQHVTVSMDYPSATGARDCNGHGTHVASTVAGRYSGVMENLPRNGVNVKGNVVIHAIRVLGCDGSGTTFDVISGLLWIYDNVQYPALVTMSLGASRSFNLDDVISLLITDKGIPVIAAAGNDASDACLVSPAGASGVTAIGSTGISDFISPFSNRGNCVDGFGPGEDILGAYFGDSTSYFYLSGTSMATPHFTSVVAGYILAYQNLYPAQQIAPVALNFVLQNATENKVKGTLMGATNLLVYVGLESTSSVVPPSSTTSSDATSIQYTRNSTHMLIVLILLFWFCL